MNNRQNPPMPKVTPMPVPVQQRPQPKPAPAELYDPEVLRIVQADVDRKRKIAELEADRDDWRRQALDAKQEINRLQMIINREQKEFDETLRKERDEHDSIVERIAHERDVFKGEVVRVRTCAQNGAAVFLQILDNGLSNAPAETAGLKAVADAVENDADAMFREVDEPMPRAVTAGPRDGDS
jgi:hypothetical protein